MSDDGKKDRDVRRICMEPFKLTLEQVNFQNDFNLHPAAQRETDSDLDSFSNVISFDSEFEFKTTTANSTYPSHPSDFLLSSGIPDTVRKKPEEIVPCTTESKPCDTRVYCVWSEKKLSPFGDEHLVNPHINFNERRSTGPSTSLTSATTSASDISTLIQVSANTKSVTSKIKEREKRRKLKVTEDKMASTEVTPAPTTDRNPLDSPNCDVSNAFETVAEALHLQWSVIGNKNLTPAPPEVVAQIVAEAEKRLKAGNLQMPDNETLMSQISSPYLPDVTQESASVKSDGSPTTKKYDTPTKPTCLDDKPSNRTPSPIDNVPSVLSKEKVEPLVDVSDSGSLTKTLTSAESNSIELPEKLPCSETCPTEPITQVENEKTADIPEQEARPDGDQAIQSERTRTDVAATPAVAATTHNPMSSSVSSSPSAIPNNTSSTLSLSEQVPREMSSERKTSEYGRSEETDSTKSASFHLSDCDADDYNYQEDSNAEAFLRSLPPVKAVELEAFLKRLRNGRHSPPVRDRSFNPVELSLESENFNSVHQATPSGKFSPPTKDIPDDVSIDSSVDLPEKDTSLPPSNFAQHVPIVPKPKISLPDPGPLFKNAMKPLTDRRSQILADKQSAGLPKVDGVNVNEILREKAKLEGQLEILTSEAQTALQERAELQAQLASLQLKFKSAQKSGTDVKQNALKADIESLKDSRVYLEHCLADTQKLLEEKIEDGKRMDEELKATQETTDKQQMKVRELKDDMRARDVTIQALKNKVAELYVEVQTTLQNKMLADTECRSAKRDLASIVSTKQWYHDQLQNANKVRVELQKEMTTLQAQVSSQGTIVERLKADSARLHQQLADTRQKAVSEKEMLARQLENIQVDMLERETAFQEIQRERRIIEETFDSKIQTVEEEKMRLSLLMQTTTELESQLEKAHSDVKKKQVQIFSLENEQTAMMKNLTLSEGKLSEKDKVIEELEQKLVEVEASLKSFHTELGSKNREILKLKEEKASVEISLASALEEKKIFDAALETLRGDLHKVENSFWQMKQELGSKMSELDQVRKEKSQVETELREAIESSKLKEDAATEQASSEAIEAATENLKKLEAKNTQLTQEVAELRSQMTDLNDRCVHEVHEKEALEKHLGSVQEELNQVKCNLEKEKQTKEELLAGTDSKAEDSKKTEDLTTENSSLKSKLKALEKKAQTNLTKQKARSAKLTADIGAVQSELMERQKAYDTNMEMFSSKLREVVNDKEVLQNEVDMLKRKFDISMIEQQDQMKVELQTLAVELETVRSQKLQLEGELTELKEVTNHQVEQYVSQVMAMGQQLQQLIDEKDEQTLEAKTKEQQLSLELEKEKGRLTGLQQSNTGLKKHVSELEEALARRESSLVEIQTHFSDNVKDRETDERDFVKRIQELEESLLKEKSNQRELRKQIGTKITENKRLKRQHKNLSLEHENLELDVQQKLSQFGSLIEELQTKKDEVQSLQSQLQSVHHDNKSLRTEVERLQRSLTDNQDRNPVIQEQLQSFQWQLQQKNSELEATQKQLLLCEERHQTELESLKKTLQNATKEMESLRSELNSSRQDKMNHQTKVAELRSALKTSIQHHKISKKVSSKLKSPAKKAKDTNASEAVPAEAVEPLSSPSKMMCRDVGTQMDNDLIEPSVTPAHEPFDIEALEQLLQDTTVQALESKPLDDLQSCLSSLRAQISGLQDQIDAHSTTIQNSGESWRDVEAQVIELQQVVQTVTNTTSCNTMTTAVSDHGGENPSSIPNTIDI